jgi:hypothetical protein
MMGRGAEGQNAIACPQPAEAELPGIQGTLEFDPELTYAGSKSRSAAIFCHVLSLGRSTEAGRQCPWSNPCST